ncbi:MAG: hypothetical protein ACP5E3_08560, partial [Bacteroidales bacterium]
IALRSSTQINFINPASYSEIDTMSFIFDFGLNGSSTTYETDDLNSQLRNMNIDHLAIGFGITPWWGASVGVSPYSYRGYNIVDQATEPDIGLVDYFYEGSGGLNRFYIGTSFMLFKRLSLGVNMTTLFGFLQNTQRVNFPSDNDASNTYVDDRLVVKGVLFNLGMQYHQEFNDKYFITLGAIFDSETSLNAEQTSLYQNFFPGRPTAINDTTVISPQYEIFRGETEGEVIYPGKFGFGLALGLSQQLTLTGDYEVQNWSNARIMGRNDSLVNSNAFKFGAEYVPDHDALRGYFNRVHYRLGGYYSNSYLRIQGEQIQDYGITFGVGLPFRGTKTTFNLGMVLGQRGTLNNNLIRENYGIINLSFTLHDFWFFKRKFD